MSFFTLSSGQKPSDILTFDTNIPDGTQLECHIVSAKNEEPYGDYYTTPYVAITVQVTQPGLFRNKSVTQKLAINSETEGDKALQKLYTYDLLCKGLLKRADEANRPLTDDLLSKALVGCPLIVTFGFYNGRNIVRNIGPKSKVEQAKDKKIMEKAKQVAEELDIDDDDEIPF